MKILNFLNSNFFVSLVVGLILIFVEEFIKKGIFRPIMEYYKLKKEICEVLLYNKNLIHNPILKEEQTGHPREIEERERAKKKLRRIASKVFAFAEKRLFFRCGVPSKEKMSSAAKALIGLSNSLFKEYGVNENFAVTNIGLEKEVKTTFKIKN